MAHRKVPLLAALLAMAWGCGSPKEASPPVPAVSPSPGAPVVVISIDTLRSDRLPAYGYAGIETPAIDALAADAILFERAYAQYPLTLPSHATLLTGQLPTVNGVRDNASYRLAPDYPIYLPRLLRAAGYATGAAVSSFAIRGFTGLGQGFDVYDDEMKQDTGPWGSERDGPSTLAAALEWLDTVEPAKPFFLFFHLYEPHLPLTPPEPFRTRYGETYDAEIAAADAVVGQLMAELKQRGLYHDSLIVFVSDHGEGLNDHGEEGHGIFLYREVIQVPLLLKLPGGRRAGSSSASPVGLVDVAPTVLEVLGLPVPEDVQGTSLLRRLDDASPAGAVYAETLYPRLHYGWSDLSSLIDGRFHYIEAPEPELYDLDADPAEKNNVLRENRRVYAEMRDRLAEHEAPFAVPAREEDEETRERLAALGYLASTRVPAEGPLPDPKVALPRHLAEFRSAIQSFSEGEPAPMLEKILEGNPQMPDVWRQLGEALRDMDRPAEALIAFEKAMRLSGGSPQVAALTGQALVDLGRLDEARAHADIARPSEPLLAAELDIAIALAAGDVDRAVQLASLGADGEEVSRATRRRVALELSDRGRHREAVALLARLADESPGVPILNALAQALLAAGRAADAEPLVERVLAEAPENALALERRGLIALQRGRPEAAREALERSIEANDRQPNAWNLLGVARFQLDDVDGALTAWERCVELDPRQWDSLYNLGFTAARVGQRARAIAALRRYVETAPPGRFTREIAEARRLLGQLGG